MRFRATVVILSVAAALLIAQTACGQQAQGSAVSTQQKLTALKQLRDSGVLTEQEYEAKVSALQPGTAAPAASAQTALSGWPGTRTVQATDPHFQMTAITLEIPATWKFAGEIGVSGAGTCHAGGASLKMTAVSQGGLFQIMQLPGVSWKANTGPQAEQDMARQGCPAIEISSAADFMVNILLPQLHPNAKIVEVLGPDDALQESMKKQFDKASENQAIWSRGTGYPQSQLRFDGARVRVQYDVDGKPVEELLSGFVQSNEMRMANGSTLKSYTSSNISMIRGPLGHLDALLALPEFIAMMKSRQPNPDWLSRVAYDDNQQRQQGINQIVQSQHLTQQMIAQSNAAFNARMQANQQFYNTLSQGNQQFINNMQARTNQSIANAQSSQAHLDAEAHQYTLYAGDKREYTNPYNGQTVVSSNRYQQQWMSSDGRTVAMTNNGANPNDYVAPGGPTFAPMVPQ
jgi:Short C-terminal domain